MFFSLRLDLDVGLGIGGKIEAMEMVGITGIFEQYAYYLSFNANGIDYGTVEYSGIGLQLGSWDVISSGHKTVHSSVTGETTESYQDEHIIGLSASGYFVIGGGVRIGWDLDYIANKWVEIWR